MIENMGYQVLPLCLFDEYSKCINNKDYLKASSLLVNITDKRYYSLKKKELIQNNQRYDVLIIKQKYYRDKGLTDEEDIESRFL